MQKFDAIFLDRDGVINYDYGHVGHWEDFKYIPKTVKTLKILANYAKHLFIITNQAGIAKGKYKLEDFFNLNKLLVDDLKLHGVKISQTYFCPHHPEGVIEDLSIICECRKPSPGLFCAALREHHLDPLACLTVGDKRTDMIASRRAKIPLNYLVQQDGSKSWDKCNLGVIRVKSLADVAQHIKCAL